MSAYNGVILPENFIVLSAADFEKIVQRRVSELAAVPLSLKEAAFAYGCDQRTVLRRIENGDIKGDKCGGKWSIETPAQRAARVNIQQLKTNDYVHRNQRRNGDRVAKRASENEQRRNARQTNRNADCKRT